MCIYCDYCVYHYKSTELVSLYTLDIGLKINIIIIIITAGQVGLGVGSWPSNRADRGIESQGNPIILRDLTQE